MANVRAKVFEYTSGLDREAGVSAEGGVPVQLTAEWTPENVLLAALLRCAVASLEHYAKPAGLAVTATGTAHGTVTLREADGVFGLVEADAYLEIELTPPPEPEALARLLARAKAGCFVSNSLSVEPTFHWRVNGSDVSAT